jgi:hypothetical protein
MLHPALKRLVRDGPSIFKRRRDQRFAVAGKMNHHTIRAEHKGHRPTVKRDDFDIVDASADCPLQLTAPNLTRHGHVPSAEQADRPAGSKWTPKESARHRSR